MAGMTFDTLVTLTDPADRTLTVVKASWGDGDDTWVLNLTDPLETSDYLGLTLTVEQVLALAAALKVSALDGAL